MHHFTAYRQRQAESAAASARRRSSSGAPDPPNTFKRFLDGQDQSAFAQLGLKHLRKPDGGFVPVGGGSDSLAGALAATAPPDSLLARSAATNRAYSDGAAMRLGNSIPSAGMTPSEAAVVELFVTAQRVPSGPALSAPAQLDERLGRTASDQTHSGQPFVDVSPLQDALARPAATALAIVQRGAPAATAAHSAPFAAALAAAGSPPGSFGRTVARAAPVVTAGHSPKDLGRAATVPPGDIPNPVGLETMESAETTHRDGASGGGSAHASPSGAAAAARSAPVGAVSAPAPAPAPRQSDLPWDAWLEQLRLYVQGCRQLPESGELGQWCSEQVEASLHLAAGSPPIDKGLSRDQYAALTALAPFAQRLALIERHVFTECLWRLQQFVAARGRMPSRWLAPALAGGEAQQKEEKELADWSAMQRRLAVRFAGGVECGQMGRERVLALMQVPGWLEAAC